MKPFIPSWLDEAGLSATEFRVLCNLWRRAERETLTCFPSAANIMETCRVAENTLWKVLRSLERKGFLSRTKGRHNSNTYTLVELVVDSAVRSNTTRDGSVPPQTAREVPPQKTTCPSPQKERHEVSPPKEIQLREPSGHSHTPVWSDMIPEPIAGELGTQMGMSPELIRNAYTQFRHIKLAYRDKAPAVAADAWGIFGQWLRTSTPGRKIVAELKAAAVATDAADRGRPNGPTPEPVGWREVAARDDEDCSWATANWDSIHPFYQQRIAKKVLAAAKAAGR